MRIIFLQQNLSCKLLMISKNVMSRWELITVCHLNFVVKL